MLVSEKMKTIQFNGQIQNNFDYSEHHNFISKKFRRSLFCREGAFKNRSINWNQKYRYERGSFRENEKNLKYGSHIPP